MNSLKFNDKRHYVLAAVLAIFIVMDIKVPPSVANLVDTIVGKVVVIMIGLSLMGVNPLVGILAVIAAYELIRRSSSASGIFSSFDFIPNEKSKANEMQVYQNNEITVEEEVIAQMLPRTATDVLDTASFKPVQDKLHAAAKL